MTRLALVAILWFVSVASNATAQEWSRFRGPNGSGESDVSTIPASWTEADYNWSVPLPGYGISSPSLWGNLLFLLSADPENATRYVLCFDADSGKKLWQKDYPSTPHSIHKLSSFASSTPAVDEERVYVAWSAPESLTFMALTHSGEVVWKNDLGPWLGQHGFGTSPILYEDLVILSNFQELKDKDKNSDVPKPKSFVMAFDHQTGEERWRTERKTDSVAYSVPAIFEPPTGAPQLINTSTSSGMYALDPKTGKEIWSTVVFDKRTVSSPLIKGDLIFGSTGSGGGGSYVTAVRTDGTKVEVAYKIDEQAPYVPTSVAYGDLLFLLSDAGIAACFDLKTGDLHWRKRIGGNYQGSPIRVADKFYCASVDGEMVVLAADKEFAELGRMPLGEGTRSTPAVARNQMFIRTFSKLMSIGGKAAQ